MVCMEWDKATGKLMLRQQRPLPLAPQTDAIFRSVKDNFISPLIAAFKIEAVNADSTALVIKVNDIMMVRKPVSITYLPILIWVLRLSRIYHVFYPSNPFQTMSWQLPS